MLKFIGIFMGTNCALSLSIFSYTPIGMRLYKIPTSRREGVASTIWRGRCCIHKFRGRAYTLKIRGKDYNLKIRGGDYNLKIRGGDYNLDRISEVLYTQTVDVMFYISSRVKRK
jgi:hypothetical protein